MAASPIDVSGKVALITGGNGGIGLGMAQALADAGAGVCIWARNEEKNAAAIEQLKASGTDVLALKCDVADEEQVEAAFQATLDHFGKVDGCFANAGIGGGGAPFHEMTTESWRRVLGVNLDGTFFTYRAAVRHMIERGEGGRLVATSSVSSVDGAPRSQHYASSKGGLNAMTRGLLPAVDADYLCAAFFGVAYDTSMLVARRAHQKPELAQDEARTAAEFSTQLFLGGFPALTRLSSEG